MYSYGYQVYEIMKSSLHRKRLKQEERKKILNKFGKIKGFSKFYKCLNIVIFNFINLNIPFLDTSLVYSHFYLNMPYFHRGLFLYRLAFPPCFLLSNLVFLFFYFLFFSFISICSGILIHTNTMIKLRDFAC